MGMSLEDFIRAGYALLPDYDTYNPWFRLLTGGVFERNWPPGEYVVTAAKCYVKSNTSADSDPFKLLGDEKIRRDSSIVGSFGLCTAMDGLEPDVQRIVAEQEARRNGIAAGASSSSTSSSSPFASPPPFMSSPPAPGAAAASSASSSSSFAPPAVAGSGAVLATRGWSPLLNDAFILGNVHRGGEFHLTLAGADRQDFLAATAGRSVKDGWLNFFRTHPIMLWDGERKQPRVLARELLGLMEFGYEPNYDFGDAGLPFKADKGKAAGASLQKYVTMLATKRFHEPNREMMLTELGTFLFRDQGALTRPV